MISKDVEQNGLKHFFSLSNEFQNFYVTDNHNERCILEFTLIESKVTGNTVLHSGNIFPVKLKFYGVISIKNRYAYIIWLARY